VAFEVAQALEAPLDVFMVRKLGVPGHEELALGAIASGGVRALNLDVLAAIGISDEQVETVAARELVELERREVSYRGRRPPLPVDGRVAIVVDDGLATGATMRAAAHALALESLGARQSPRGDSEPPEPTLGALGMDERLNWLEAKKRSRNTASQRLISARLYWLRRSAGIRSGHRPRSRSAHACSARKATLLGRYPNRSTW
jgi:hypothetical protein